MGALSILLIAAGAIMSWAVKDTSSGFDVHMIGIILLVVGIVGLVASLARGTYADITAYILEVNGFQAGDASLQPGDAKIDKMVLK